MASVAPVTVVISTLDRPDRLRRCLHSLGGGSVQPAEVVVVDQGLRAPADAVVAEATQRGMHVVHHKQASRGLSRSQNAGVAAASNPVVAIVDDDCVPDRAWLEVVDSAFRQATGPLLLTGRVLPLPPDGERTEAVSTRDGTERREWARPPMPWTVGTGGNFAVTRASFLAVGGNDERLGTGAPGRGGNDLDLFHRLMSAGVAARYEPFLLVRHERSTVAEHRSRRGSYGYGAGAMLGLWLRRGEPGAMRVLAAWLVLRARRAYQLRAAGGPAQEARVLWGTAAGLAYGVRAGRPDRVPS